jgi:glycosyltransferase involved in cell wall biosynthesis
MSRLTRRRLEYIRDIVRQGPTETGYAYFRARRRKRNVPDDELDLPQGERAVLGGRFDLDPAVLAANAEVLAGYAAADELDVRTLHWFIPAFDNAAVGGIQTILRFADHVRRRHGVDSGFSLFDTEEPGTARAVEKRMAAAFPSLAGSPVLTARERPGACDAALASSWASIDALIRFADTRAKLVFVQDWEPDFEPAGSSRAVLDEAAGLAFPGIVNTPALADSWRERGNPAVSFMPAVDTERFHPATVPRPDGPVRIFFYGRPWVTRNAFGLGIRSLRRVKQSHGDRVEILCAGGDWSPGQYGVADVVENLGMLDSLDAVAELYRSCDLGLVFMLTRHPSYQPLEFMASGMATVSNVNPHTAWFLQHERNALLAPPIPAMVADQIGRLIEDQELRERLVATGLEEVRRVRWDDQFERIWGGLTKRGEQFTTTPELSAGATGARRSEAPRG